MLKKITSVAMAALLSVSLIACGSSSENGQSGASTTTADTSASGQASTETADSTTSNEPNEDIAPLTKIGWSSDILSSNFTSGLATKFQESCDALGIEIEMQDANRDMNLQINQVENMIANGCQVMVLKPYDMSACQPISEACKEAGIPLVIICSDISSDYDCAVLVSNEDTGRMKAEAIVEALNGEGNVAILNGTLSQQGWALQADAAKAVFEQYPGITIVDEQVAENNDLANAITVAENWITAGMDIDAIWCSQDTVAIGAGQAFKEANLDVYVVGQGGMEDAQSAIREGSLDATVYLPSSVYVDGAMQAVQALYYGNPIDKDLVMQLKMLTADNIDTFDFN